MGLPVVFHKDYEAPLRAGHRFPMSKYGYLRNLLVKEGVVRADDFAVPAFANRPLLTLAHDAAYVDRVMSLSLSVEEAKRIGLPQSEAMRRRVRLSAAGTLLTARLALNHGVACNAAGGSHHADHYGGAGFCVFNDVAVAAAALLSDGTVGRIVIVDLDVHQGDGTARIFHGSHDVFTLSIHAAANFPAEKAQSDHDVPLPDGTEDERYLRAVDEALEAAPAADLIFYNAGVDPHRDDRLGRLSLSDHGIARRDNKVIAWAKARATPIVGVLGGGYGNSPTDIAARHLSLFHGADTMMRG
ncbi:MAG: histone deacetylase [Pikeienuella sp.]